MQVTKFLPFFLATAATAIDIYFHHNSHDCSGNAAVCFGWSPDNCCYSSANSLGWRGVPRDWNIVATGYGGGGCANNQWQTFFPNGQDWSCMTALGSQYTGAMYWFSGKKRSISESFEESCPAEQQRCKTVRKPDAFVLADGTQYNIQDLEGEELDEIINVAATTVADMPKKYMSRLIG